MAVSKIDKIKLIAHEVDKKEILEILYDRGFMEIIKEEVSDEGNDIANKKDNGLSSIEYELAKARHALDVLKPFYVEKLSFLDKLNFEKPLITQKKLNKLLAGHNYKIVSETIGSYGQDLNSLRSLVAKLNEDINFLAPWKDLGIITGDSETANAFTVFGTMELSDYEMLMAQIDEMPKRMSLEIIKQDNGNYYLMAITHKDAQTAVREFLDKYSFKTQELPKFDITIKVRIERLEHEKRTTTARIENLEARISDEAKYHYKNMQIIVDQLKWQLDQVLVQDNFMFTDSTFSITGWLPSAKLDELKLEITQITKSFEVFIMPAVEGEDRPILMSNAKLMQPFEFVTNIYGFPKYNEVDPTPFLAGFFIIFFGLCLTDAGYGIALGVTSLLALKYLKVSREFRKLLKVLFAGSIVTFVAGGLTGGWFGIVLDDLGPAWSWLAVPLIAIRKINPVEEPITMLIISIILGYIHLLFGNAIDIWWKAKHGDLRAGLIDSGVWIYFLLAVGLWIVSSQGIAFTTLTTISTYIVYSSIALIIFTQGKGKNFVAKIFGGLAELYFGVSGYISDILSYSRLLALGLATGIIGMVVNIVGGMANDMIPYVGWIFMILILVGGHLLNLVISLVGAFIHSGRLQYVEFFKHFFDGGGKLFKPFVRESVYVDYIKDSEIK